MAVTATTKNAQTEVLNTVAYTAGAVIEDEANCRVKFHDINAGAVLISGAFAAAEANNVILQGNAVKVNADRIVKQTSTLSATDTLTAGLPAGYIVRDVVIKCTKATTASAAITLDVETSSGGKQIVNAGTIDGTLNAITRCTVVAHAVPAAAADVIFTSADWKAGEFSAYLAMEKVLY